MMKQIKQTLLVVAVLASGSLAVLSPTAVLAADNWEVGSGNESTTGGTADKGDCGGVKTAIIKCSDGAGEGAIIGLLKFGIQIMTMGVGVLAVAGIIYAGILYASAAGAQEQVKKAKMMIFNVVIGLAAYAFMVSLLEFLIPGGVFN